MRLGNCEASHFGSYEHLEIDFLDLGLTILHGKTGSGKSTIPDVPFWVLFGSTAKGGTADEVISWHASGAPAKATLEVHLDDATVIVTRIRGPKVSDLYWHVNGGPAMRGKDLVDSQKQLNILLGFDRDTYELGAYFHEFSASGGFFTAKAKDRRDVFEKIANLSFATDLGDRLGEAKRINRKAIQIGQSVVDRAHGALEQALSTVKSSGEYATGWEAKHAAQLAEMRTKRDNFAAFKESQIAAAKTKSDFWEIQAAKDKTAQEKAYAKIEAEVAALHAEINAEIKACVPCKTCGHKPPSQIDPRGVARLEARLAIKPVVETNPWPYNIEVAKNLDNRYVTDVLNLEGLINPHTAQVAKAFENLETTQDHYLTKSQELRDLEAHQATLEDLTDLAGEFRAQTLQKTIKLVEDNTNALIEQHFDAALRVEFNAGTSDSLDIGIQKDGNECSYKQLSKGQRQILKLCFSRSVMDAVSERSGVLFKDLFFDEALDGLDTELKVKAFSLFENISADTIVLIDHAPEFQNMFTNRVAVTLDNDRSTLTYE